MPSGHGEVDVFTGYDTSNKSGVLLVRGKGDWVGEGNNKVIHILQNGKSVMHDG